MDYPQRNEQNIIDDVAVDKAKLVIDEELEWIFRKQPENDYGIDAHIEIVNERDVTGEMISLQIKGSRGNFQVNSSDELVFYGELHHLNYWLNHSLPVVLILVDIENDDCYWREIRQDMVEETSEGRWKIEIPRNRHRFKLGEHSKEKLKVIAQNQSDYEGRLYQLITFKPFMEEIESENHVYLEASQWIHKSHGRGNIELEAIDSWTMDTVRELSWKDIYFPHQSMEDVIPKLFPWADYQLDEEVYREHDEFDYRDEFGYWGETEFLFDEEEFQDWRDRLPDFRPYSVSSGEVASYRFRLFLNDLGEAFLRLDQYLNEGEYYRGVSLLGDDEET